MALCLNKGVLIPRVILVSGKEACGSSLKFLVFHFYDCFVLLLIESSIEPSNPLNICSGLRGINIVWMDVF